MSKRVRPIPDGLHHLGEGHQQVALPVPDQDPDVREVTPLPHQPNGDPAAALHSPINIYVLDGYEVLPGTPRNLLIDGITVDLMRLTHAQFTLVTTSPAGSRVVRKK